MTEISNEWISNSRSERVQVTPVLRWSKAGVLQQKHEIYVYDAKGVLVSGRLEWRDVPTEPE